VLYVYLDYLLGLFLDTVDWIIVATLTALLGVFVINYFFAGDYFLVVSTTDGEFVAPVAPWTRAARAARAAPTRA